MTWNLWWRYGPWERRREAIAAVLAEVAPDVCGFQEVWSAGDENLAGDLAARLGMHWCWASIPVHGDAPGPPLRLGNAILSRWPITAQAELQLPTVGEVHERRFVAHARIETPGGTLPFFTTHLSYGLGLSSLRVQQVRSLAAFVADNGLDCEYPPVVTGDLNAEPESDEVRRLAGFLTAPAAPGLVLLDAWRYAAPGDPGFTWALRNGYQEHSKIPDSRIDYILVGVPSGDRGRVLSARLAGDEPVNQVWPSDHFAVVADLQD
ncbi:MAG: endonuclease/exonuclease/phosphatase family protein [Micromonosporaceae bacterium]|jgi:endonuclease/exonuclease/phosphatase family metal-dependent hydrolase|nr:endonuclease/exonuclease/phosphatase family protein [Micromonosporaceae bacterium]